MNQINNFKNNLINLYQTYLRSTSSLSRENVQKLSAGLYLIFSLLTVSLFGIFAINPTLTTISNLKKQYQDNILVKNALYEKISNLKQLGDQYKNISASLDLLYDILPTTNQVPYFTAQLQSLAKKNNLTLSRLEIGKTEVYPVNKKNDNIYSFLFQIAVTGKDLDLNNFIREIISFNRLISLENLSFEQTAKTNNLLIGGKAFFNKK